MAGDRVVLPSGWGRSTHRVRRDWGVLIKEVRQIPKITGLIPVFNLVSWIVV
jgi:hypothetical protein